MIPNPRFFTAATLLLAAALTFVATSAAEPVQHTGSKATNPKLVDVAQRDAGKEHAAGSSAHQGSSFDTEWPGHALPHRAYIDPFAHDVDGDGVPEVVH